MPDPSPIPSLSADARDRLVAIVVAAFDAARESGKEPWREMQAGVLKNRILLDNKDFTETDFGAPTFTTLLEAISDVVRIDRSRKPALVVLQGEPATDSGPPLGRPRSADTLDVQPARDSRARWKVRSDVWDAIMNVGADAVYVWDDGSVRRVAKADLRQDDPRPVLPTLTSEELTQWQRDFGTQEGAGDRELAATLERWASREESTWALPRPVRNRWFAHLKLLVRRRLEQWFEDRGQPLPADVFEETSTARPSPESSEGPSALRAMVIRTVEAMTRTELEALPLPAAAVLRAQR